MGRVHMVVLYDCLSYLIILWQGAPDNIVIGSHVWVEDPSLAWIDGEVFRINDQEVHVRTTNGKTVCSTYQLVLFSFYSVITSFRPIKI